MRIWNSLRFRFAIAAAAFTLPLGVVQWVLVERAASAAQARLEEQHHHITTLVLEHQRQFLGATISLLQGLAHVENLTLSRPQSCTEVLERAMATLDQRYAILSVARRDGTLTCSTKPLGAGSSVADRVYFLLAQATGQPVVGERVIGRLTGEPSLHVAVPIAYAQDGDGELLIAGISLDWLQTEMEALGLARHQSVSLLDRQGRVLAKVPRTSGQTSLRDSTTTTAGLQACPIDSPRAERLCSLQPVMGSDAAVRVLVMTSAADVDATAFAIRRDGLAAMLVATLGAFVLVLLLGETWLTRPVDTLARQAQRIADNELDAVTPRPLRGELGKVSLALDRLTERLKSTERERNQATSGLARADIDLRLLQAAINEISDGVLITDCQSHERTESHIVFVNRAVERVTGYAPDELLGKTPRLFQGKATDRAALDRIRTCLAQGEPSKETLVNYRKDGTTFWVDLDVFPLRANGESISHYVGIQRDVTQRTQASQALEESETLYRLLFEWNPLPLVIYDRESLTFLALNPAALNLFRATGRDYTGKHLVELWKHRSREFLQTRIEALPDGLSYEPETRLYREDASSFDAEIWRFAAELNGRRVVIFSPRDITERRRAEVALRQSEIRYRTLFDSNPLPMWLYHPETLSFISVNEATVRTYGYTRAELLGMTLRELQSSESLAEFDAALAQRPTGLVSSQPRIHRRKDGSLLQVEITANDVSLGSTTVRLVSVVDITERQRAEQALRELNVALEGKVAERTEELASELAYRKTLFENAPQLLVVLDRAGRLIQANRMLASLLGGSEATWQGRRWQDVIHPDDVQQVDAVQAGSTLTDQPITRELRIRAASGEYRVHQVHAAPVQDARGRVLGWIVIATDLTELLKVEEELRRSNQELEAFSYSVSHDLRAPLHAIDGFSAALQTDHGSLLDARGQHYIERIRAGVQRMGRLIEALLELSRVTRMAMRITPVDLATVASEIVEQLRAEEPERQVMVTIERPLPAHGDEVLLRVVMENLLRNAWKFTSGRADAAISVSRVVDDAGERTYRVADNGAGFDPRYAGKLFGVFQRLHSSDEYAGSGIGLATVQRILRRHGGRIWADGQPGRGARFYFTVGPNSKLESRAAQVPAVDNHRQPQQD